MPEPLPLPPVMLARIMAEEAADDARRAQAAMNQADDVAMARRMNELADHRHQAATGHTLAEWEHARQSFAQARADAGRDLAAPVGSAANPELLVGGVSTAMARRHQPLPDPVGVELARAEEGRRAWESDPALLRMRAASARARGPYRPPLLSRSAGIASRPAGLPEPAEMTPQERRAEIRLLEAELSSLRPVVSRSRGRPVPAVHPRVARLHRLPFGRIGGGLAGPEVSVAGYPPGPPGW